MLGFRVAKCLKQTNIDKNVRVTGSNRWTTYASASPCNCYLIYNRRMVPGFRYLAGAAALVQFGALGLAGQGFDDEPVRVVPRVSVNAPGPAGQANLRVNSSLVLIPAHITTAAGSPVVNLRKEDFALFEDGVPQTITHFAQDDAPVSVGVLLDTSGSMKNKMSRVSAAATEFFRFANPEDEFFLIEV